MKLVKNLPSKGRRQDWVSVYVAAKVCKVSRMHVNNLAVGGTIPAVRLATRQYGKSPWGNDSKIRVYLPALKAYLKKPQVLPTKNTINRGSKPAIQSQPTKK